eukprot:TRINITY_DN3790_c0_g1_i2.p1 TRINITY_DN3790_c0_g1~~TRINITY_DN3790_c0_g1_i2.p1  ORF type:complete len:314 (+),score=58.31 TRINITY_DN3790_c0_g1_i2:122-1063(+)
MILSNNKKHEADNIFVDRNKVDMKKDSDGDTKNSQSLEITKSEDFSFQDESSEDCFTVSEDLDGESHYFGEELFGLTDCDPKKPDQEIVLGNNSSENMIYDDDSYEPHLMLPFDVLEYVTTLLHSIKDIGSLFLTCKYWNNLDCPRFWKHRMYNFQFRQVPKIGLNQMHKWKSLSLIMSKHCRLAWIPILEKYGDNETVDFSHSNIKGIQWMDISSSDPWIDYDTFRPFWQIDVKNLPLEIYYRLPLSRRRGIIQCVRSQSSVKVRHVYKEDIANCSPGLSTYHQSRRYPDARRIVGWKVVRDFRYGNFTPSN